MIGNYDREPIRRLNLVVDHLNRRQNAYAFRMVDICGEWDNSIQKFCLIADIVTFLVDGVGVFNGEFDARAIVAAAGDFEPTGEQGDFDVYEGTGDGFFGTEGLAFAVRDDVLVTLLNRDADLEMVLETIGGDADSLSESDDEGWALAEAGHGHVTLGVWGVEPAQATETEYDREFVDVDGVFENADGLVSSLTLGPDEGTGTIAAVFPSGETPQRAAIENEVGTSASSRDIEIDDTRVSINGIWRVPDEESDD